MNAILNRECQRRENHTQVVYMLAWEDSYSDSMRLLARLIGLRRRSTYMGLVWF
jgi:hypothetical protein